jgi:organic hydroperoxide reductase OsmC/OhrA
MLQNNDTDMHQFEVQLNWQGKTKGIIMANDVKDTLRVATAEGFPGGMPGMWSPEHLFLSSVISCHMTTFLGIAEKKQLAVTHFECGAKGHMKMKEGRPYYTSIDIYPKVFVEKDTDIALAGEVLAMANRYCIVMNSISVKVIHHDQVLTDDHPVTRNNPA